MSRPHVRQVVENHRVQLVAIPGVEEVAPVVSPLKPQDRCVLVYVSEDVEGVPDELEGYRVEIRRTVPSVR